MCELMWDRDKPTMTTFSGVAGYMSAEPFVAISLKSSIGEGWRDPNLWSAEGLGFPTPRRVSPYCIGSSHGGFLPTRGPEDAGRDFFPNVSTTSV